MRKLISIIFISVFCSNVVLAAITCTQSATTECEVGCYVSSTLGCISCANGTYRGATDSIDQCLPCVDPPAGATFTGPGTAADKCPWQITCDAGHAFFDLNPKPCTACEGNTFQPDKFQITGTGNGDDAAADPRCMECGANSSPNDEHTACICKDGYHVSNSDNDTDITYTDDTLSCTANKYVIEYVFNPNEPENDKTIDVYYDTEFITLTEKDYGGKNTGKTISNWIYKSSDGTNTELAAGETFQYTYTTDIILTAVWTGKKFTVEYDTGDATDSDCTPADQTCTYGDTNCCASHLLNTCTYNGYVFKGWKCRSGCGNSNETIINQNDDISKLSGGENMKLTAIWEQCPVGYYCDNPKEALACPAGSTTSKAGSVQIDDCYMDPDITNICDTAGNCFKWPTTVTQIYYRGGTQQ